MAKANKITLYVGKELNKRITDASEQTKTSVSELCQKFVEDGLNRRAGFTRDLERTDFEKLLKLGDLVSRDYLETILGAALAIERKFLDEYPKEKQVEMLRNFKIRIDKTLAI